TLYDGHPSDLGLLSRGSSYSAPRLSAVEAIYLSKTGILDCNGNHPTLGYVNGMVTSPPLPWKDVPKSYLPISTPAPSPTPSPTPPPTTWDTLCNNFVATSGAATPY